MSNFAFKMVKQSNKSNRNSKNMYQGSWEVKGRKKLKMKTFKMNKLIVILLISRIILIKSKILDSNIIE